MKVFIPSKDRAAQLDLLLRSMRENLPNMNFDCFILYKCLDSNFEKGYRQLFSRCENNAFKVTTKFYREFDFAKQFIGFLEENINEKVMLLTDDCVFYRKNECFEDDINDLMTEDVWCFSYRMGLNTNVQYYVTQQQQQPIEYFGYKDLDKYIKWNWKIRPHFENRGYFISWDSHIYLSKDLLDLSKKIQFYNPRTFEDKLTKDLSYRYSICKKHMVSPKLSSCFCNTINVTQEDGCLAGIKHHYSLQDLNNIYVNKNKKILIRSFDNIQINASHEEIPPIFDNMV